MSKDILKALALALALDRDLLNAIRFIRARLGQLQLLDGLTTVTIYQFLRWQMALSG